MPSLLWRLHRVAIRAQADIWRTHCCRVIVTCVTCVTCVTGHSIYAKIKFLMGFGGTLPHVQIFLWMVPFFVEDDAYHT